MTNCRFRNSVPPINIAVAIRARSPHVNVDAGEEGGWVSCTRVGWRVCDDISWGGAAGTQTSVCFLRRRNLPDAYLAALTKRGIDLTKTYGCLSAALPRQRASPLSITAVYCIVKVFTVLRELLMNRWSALVVFYGYGVTRATKSSFPIAFRREP